MKKLLRLCALLLAASPAAAARADDRLDPFEKCQPAAGAWSAPRPTDAARREMEAKLAEARAAYERNPRDADAAIWFGRRTAYLGHFKEAIRIYTWGIQSHPRDARLYRHRGHRYITVRCFDAAVRDLERAARLVRGKPDEVEPDGQPNARNTPTGTIKTNIYYHLGLAHYLRGDFKKALAAYRQCLDHSRNPDMLVAAAHWLYMTLRRLGREREAEQILALVRSDMDIIENGDYHRLLLMYKGELRPERLLAEVARREAAIGFASTAYGVGNWYLYTKQPEKALRTFLRVVEGPQTTSFGYIAAEAELRRLGLKDFPRRQLPLRVIN